MKTSDISKETFNRAIREIVHEINDILGVIFSVAQFLQQNEELSENVREGLKLIEDTAREGIAFAKRLRRIVPIQSPEPRDIDLRRLLEEVAQEFRKLGLNVDLILELGKRELKVIGDPEGLKLALREILMNSFEAMSEGGKVKIKACFDEQKIRVDFIDEGEGMSEEVKSRAFEPFFTTKQRHFGIGLNIASGIVQSHGGKVELESEPGGGTKVSIVLPRESS